MNFWHLGIRILAGTALALILSLQIAPEIKAHDFDLVDEHEYILIDNPNFTGIFVIKKIPGNPVDKIDGTAITHQDGSVVSIEDELPEVCIIQPDGTCTISYDSPLQTITVYTGNKTGEIFVKTANQTFPISFSTGVVSTTDPATTPSAGTTEDSLPTPDASCKNSLISPLGWILCPLTEGVLDVLEGILRDGIVKSILDFDVLDKNSDSNQREALLSIWGGFRTLANIGFVIVFFIAIYSAASGGILSSYDVKKLLPKLLIGAILVQLSFFITTQLVAIFNALGNSVVDLMLAPLGGEAAAGSGALYNTDIISLGTFTDGVTNSVTMLLLILVLVAGVFSILGVLLMVMVFLLRNMALMILTVISPLAFVAWILPNTEGLFKKWWGAYIQLLALFPIAMAFLASGRLVSFIWASGDGFASQWVGTIALFLPYILAPKMFSFAGSAVSTVVRSVDNTKNGIKQRGGRLRNTEMGKRAEAQAKAKGASIATNRYGAGGTHTDTRFGKIASKAVQSKAGTRATAKAVEGRRKIEDTDTAASTILQKEQVARVRSEALNNGQSADEAEIKFLVDIMNNKSGSSSDSDIRASASRLATVHSSDVTAATALTNFVQDSRRSSDRGTQALGEKIVQENPGALLSDIPQAVRGVGGSVSQSTSSVIKMKGGAQQDLVGHYDKENNWVGGRAVSTDPATGNKDTTHLAALANKYAEASQNDNLRGEIGDGNLQALAQAMVMEGMNNSNHKDHATWQELTKKVDISTDYARDANNQVVVGSNGQPRLAVAAKLKPL